MLTGERVSVGMCQKNAGCAFISMCHVAIITAYASTSSGALFPFSLLSCMCHSLLPIANPPRSQLMLSVGGGEGGGTKSPRRALLLLDTGARTPRLLLAARGLSGGLGLRVDPAPEDSVGGNLKMQTGDLDTVRENVP